MTHLPWMLAASMLGSQYYLIGSDLSALGPAPRNESFFLLRPPAGYRHLASKRDTTREVDGGTEGTKSDVIHIHIRPEIEATLQMLVGNDRKGHSCRQADQRYTPPRLPCKEEYRMSQKPK